MSEHVDADINISDLSSKYTKQPADGKFLPVLPSLNMKYKSSRSSLLNVSQTYSPGGSFPTKNININTSVSMDSKESEDNSNRFSNDQADKRTVLSELQSPNNISSKQTALEFKQIQREAKQLLRQELQQQAEERQNQERENDSSEFKQQKMKTDTEKQLKLQLQKELENQQKLNQVREQKLKQKRRQLVKSQQSQNDEIALQQQKQKEEEEKTRQQQLLIQQQNIVVYLESKSTVDYPFAINVMLVQFKTFNFVVQQTQIIIYCKPCYIHSYIFHYNYQYVFELSIKQDNISNCVFIFRAQLSIIVSMAFLFKVKKVLIFWILFQFQIVLIYL
ncbi:Conserved_hypothetical protein [Hexamita inflata]|uniref:Uncharacterized protein n=1 Tax=Hexamita inflata TaxID=28002 RepID=A0AA86NLT0_9EUKA|nr:Conserved hypothetical protein [Hexamita inflata]